MRDVVLPTIRMDTRLKQRLTAKAKASGRSLSEQVRYYATLAILAEDNPDLPLSMILDIVEGKEEADQGLLEAYPWEA